MIKSMTGYGKAEGIYNGIKIIVEIKSVNHRYLDVTVRLPSTFSLWELEIRKRVAEIFSRGKLEIFIKIETEKEADCGRKLSLNVPLLRNYYELLLQIKKELNLSEEVTLAQLSGMKDLFIASEPLADQEGLKEALLGVVEEALAAARQMREKEGEMLCQVMEAGGNLVEERLVEIRARGPLVIDEYRRRLNDRIRELTNGLPLDEGRLMTEVAIMAEKSDITEEVDRLRSHLGQFYELLNASAPVGRPLDFLVQEMGREANTMGAKSNDLASSRTIIEVKGEIAKLKEQIQNIE
ncbi:MAG: YicC/YloC family endoribonuclease [Smithellaceae bacterium]|nr:YicC/YloC family endoribonuclease [Smithellaceae bacterium]